MAVYDNKCVITTDVSLGSIITSNALDGQKTIFYIDVQGIQFKKSGLAQVQNKLQEQERLLELKRAEKQKMEQGTKQRELEDFRRSIQEKDGAGQMEVFLSKASACTRIGEIHRLWQNFPWESCDGMNLIEKK